MLQAIFVTAGQEFRHLLRGSGGARSTTPRNRTQAALGSPGDAMSAGAGGTSFTIDRAERLVGVFMAQGPSNRVLIRMLFKNLVYGAMVGDGRA